MNKFIGYSVCAVLASGIPSVDLFASQDQGADIASINIPPYFEREYPDSKDQLVKNFLAVKPISNDDVGSDYNTTTIVEKLMKLAPEQQETVLKGLKETFQRTGKCDAELVDLFAPLNQEDISTTLLQADPLFQLGVRPEHGVEAVLALPSEIRSESIAKYASLVGDICRTHYLEPDYLMFGLNDKATRENFKNALPIFNDTFELMSQTIKEHAASLFSYPCNTGASFKYLFNSHLIGLMTFMNAYNTEDFNQAMTSVKGILSLVKPNDYQISLSSLFERLSGLSPSQIEGFNLALHKLKEYNLRSSDFLFDLMQEVAPEGRKFSLYKNIDLLNKLNHLSTNLTLLQNNSKYGNGKYYGVVLRGMPSCETEEQREILALAEPILKKTQNNQNHVFSAIEKLPLARRKVIADLTAKLMLNKSDGMHQIQPLMGRINTLYTADPVLFERDLPKLYGALKKPEDYQIVLEHLRDITPELRNRILGTHLDFLGSFTNGTPAVISALASIPEEDWSGVIEATSSLLESIGSGYYYSQIMQVVHQLNLHKSPEKRDLFDKYEALLKRVDIMMNRGVNFDAFIYGGDVVNYQELDNYHGRGILIQALSALDDSMIEKAITSFQKIQNEAPAVFNDLLIHDLSVIFEKIQTNGVFTKETLFEYWENVLRTSPDQEKVRRIANVITRDFHRFGLLEEDELVQLALRFSINLNNSQFSRNPYKIFKDLEDKLKTPVDLSLISPKTLEIEGAQYALNPQYIRDEMAQYAIKPGDLLPYSPNLLSTLSDRLKEKVRSNQELDKEIEESMGMTVNDLINAALGDGILYRHVNPRTDIDGNIPVIAARFMTSMAYVESLSQEIPQGGQLSNQEEVFLKLLASIQGCPTGKAGGINDYYLHVLPSEFKYSKAATSTEADGVEDLNTKMMVSKVLREEIEKQFSGLNALMKDLVGLQKNDLVQQASHQGLYLRNLIGSEVGLGSKLSFDPHTPLLYSALVDTTKQKALETFYNHMTPENVIQKLSEYLHLDQEYVAEHLAGMGVLRKS